MPTEVIPADQEGVTGEAAQPAVPLAERGTLIALANQPTAPPLAEQPTAILSAEEATARPAGTAALPSALPVDVGQCVGSYRLVGKLGEGGMGVVFDAQHTRLSRRAAIKMLRPQFSRNPAMVARFFTEAESVNVINHPDIVSVYEFGQLPDQTVYIVMEYLAGETLSKRIERSGGRLGQDGLRLMRHVASALTAAHAHGIVHRDLKPDNVMIIADPDVPGGERAKVVDFGIAKMRMAALPERAPAGPEAETQPEAGGRVTRAGQVMGTPLYMSPEQFRDAAAVTDKADVYSLGVMLYEALAGRPPFTGQSFAEIAAQHLGTTPPPLRAVADKVPVVLARLVDRMLAKDAAQRPPMSEVGAVLDRLVLGPRRLSAPRIALLSALSVLVILSSAFAVYQLAWRRRVDLPDLQGRALLVLREGLRDDDPALRGRAVVLLARGRDASYAALLDPLLTDRDPGVQVQAAAGLQRLGTRTAVPALLHAVQQRGVGEAARVQMAGALLQLGEGQGEAVLRGALRARDPAVRRRAALLLGAQGDAEARGLLLRDEILDDERVAALGRLMRFGDRDAEQALRRGLQLRAQEAPGEPLLRIAEELARNEDAPARALLEEVSRQEGAIGLRAARVLTTLDDPSFFDRFTRRFQSLSAPLAERALAAEGLGACGRRDGAPPLARVLPREAGQALRLRLAAAGGLLEIVSSDPSLLATGSLSLVRGGLADARWDQRVLATLALGDAEPRLGLPLLGQAAKDPQAEVRRSAAYAAGRTRARAALPVLAQLADDGVVVVRAEAVRSLGKVGQHLRRRGESVKDVVRIVTPRAARGDDHERLVAVLALTRLGEQHQAELRGWLRSGDAQLRQRALEAWAADPAADLQVLRAALRDPAEAVRFEAALRLAERDSPEGAAVLQGALASQGAEAVIARGLLRRLGLAAPGSLELASAPAERRAAMVAAAHYLPEGEALALLRGGAQQPAAAVRLAVVEELAETPELAQSPPGRRLLRFLLDDPDALVRSRAGLLAGRLGLSPAPAAPKGPARPRGEAPSGPAAPQASPPDLALATGAVTSADLADLATPADAATPERADLRAQGPAPAASASARGRLRVEAESGVRFQIDRLTEQVAPAGSVVLSAGRHRVRHARGALEVDVPAGETVMVRLPVTRGAQVLQDGLDAYKRGALAEAQRDLEQARRMLTQSGASAEEWYRLLYHLGLIYEAQQRWLQAMAELEALARKAPLAERSPAQRVAVTQATARVARHLGRIRVGELVNGRCRTTELWLLPGAHVLQVSGKRTDVRVRAGEIQTVERCR